MIFRKWFLVGLVALATGFIRPSTAFDSLEKVDDYPLYTLHYYGDYDEKISADALVLDGISGSDAVMERQPAWGCSLFAALRDPDNALYGRNFDWEFSPALLLFTYPKDAYTSVSMVDLRFAGFTAAEARNLTELSDTQLTRLRNAPLVPIDGMNEMGLAVAMAAVPAGNMLDDPSKMTIGSLQVMREILDHAATVDEALAILQSYNIRFSPGPPLHYMVADASGQALLVEYYQGEMYVIPNTDDWLQATNFIRSAAGETAQGYCTRYDRMNAQLGQTDGWLTEQDALDLLANVAQSITQWSVVYNMDSGQINVAMGQDYRSAHTFQLEKPEDD